MMFRIKHVGYEYVEFDSFDEVSAYAEMPTTWTDVDWEPVEISESGRL